jgi:hypothetical protein
VVNATESEQKFDLSTTGARLAGPSTLWQLTGSSLDAANHVGQPPQAGVKEISPGDAQGTITVAPISVNIIRSRSLRPLSDELHPGCGILPRMERSGPGATAKN